MKELNNHKQAYIDYYNQHNIIPVSQDIEDAEFIARRQYLYTTLGVPLESLKNKSIIEIGPGGGFNAVATSLYFPKSYSFVDASTASIRELKDKTKKGLFHCKSINIIEANAFDLSINDQFDLVIAEGMIPGQSSPELLMSKIAKLVVSGGIFITTFTSSTSVLSEICRRLLRIKIFQNYSSFEDRVENLGNIIDSHLNTLPAKNKRPTKDWVCDVLVQDLHKLQYAFSFLDASEILESNNLSFYQSQPRFILDGRWYKSIKSEDLYNNAYELSIYKDMLPYFLDYRVPFDNAISEGSTIVEIANHLCHLHNKMTAQNSYEQFSEFKNVLSELSHLLPDQFQITKESIADYLTCMDIYINNEENVEFKLFKCWWGRGQQYISFIKRPDTSCV